MVKRVYQASIMILVLGMGCWLGMFIWSSHYVRPTLAAAKYAASEPSEVWRGWRLGIAS